MKDKPSKLEILELELEQLREGLRPWAKAMAEVRDRKLHEHKGQTWEQFCAEHCPGQDMEIVEAMITIGLYSPETQN